MAYDFSPRSNDRTWPGWSVPRLFVLVLGLTLLLAACGDSTDPVDDPVAADNAGQDDDADPGDDTDDSGGDDEAEETEQPEETFDIVFLSNFSGNITLRTLEEAIEYRAAELGADVTIFDAQLDVQQQVNQAEQGIAQRPDAIIASAMDPSALFPVLNRAREEGIHVFGFDVNFEEDPDAYGPIIAQVTQGRANGAEEAARFYADQLGGEGEIAIVDIAFPVPSLQFLISEFERHLADIAPGITVLETVGNPSDDAEGARPLVDQLLTKYPDLDGIFAYNDPSAVGAAAAADAVGRDDLLITGFNGSPDGIQAVEDGRLAATWDVRPVDMGTTIVDAVISVLRNEASPDSLDKSLPVPSQMYTQDDVGDFVPWTEQLEALR